MSSNRDVVPPSAGGGGDEDGGADDVGLVSGCWPVPTGGRCGCWRVVIGRPTAGSERG